MKAWLAQQIIGDLAADAGSRPVQVFCKLLCERIVLVKMADQAYAYLQLWDIWLSVFAGIRCQQDEKILVVLQGIVIVSVCIAKDSLCIAGKMKAGKRRCDMGVFAGAEFTEMHRGRYLVREYEL